MAHPPLKARPAARGLAARSWPYAVVVLVGAVLWSLVWGLHLEQMPGDASDQVMGLTVVAMLADVMLGLAAIAVLPLRHRAPLTVAIAITAGLTVSASASAAAIFAIIHALTVGTRRALVLMGAVWTVSAVVNTAVVFPALGVSTSLGEVALIAAIAVLAYAVLAGIGRYRRARAETLALLHERAENAEQQRERDVQAAREGERVRIAREMHDVLAHRISLVSMHAGALTYREDLPREKVTEAAQVIQDNAALALRELRELLGVLRDSDGADALAPQPTLAELPVLLAESRAAGVPVAVQFSGMGADGERPMVEGLAPSRSRTAYRVVQEALTNARKHAPGEPVRLDVGRIGDRLTIAARNRVPLTPTAAAASGLGLVGLAERVELAGGHVVHERTGHEFVLTAWIPWT